MGHLGCKSKEVNRMEKNGSKKPKDIYTAGSYLPLLGRSKVLARFIFELCVFYHWIHDLQFSINDE